MAVSAKEFANRTEKAYSEKRGYIWATSGEVWTKAKQESLKKQYEEDPGKYKDYKLSVQEGSKWIGHKVDDCSGLVKDIASKLGLKGIYHGSNSQFNKNCVKTGKIANGMKLPVGALIFTGNESEHNHVGILTSETCVTEAQSVQKGVIHTPLSNKKWTYWGLLKGLTYDFTPGENLIPDNVTLPITLKTLRKGAKGLDGDAVAYLQELLIKNGESLPKYGVDGDFGTETLKAVKSFQQKHGLVVDGIVGPKTWTELVKNAGSH